MILSSYSKINLTLQINNKGRNKLHEIQSFFCLIDLADKIKIKKNKTKKDRITFNGPFAKLVSKSNNSILELLRTLRKEKFISNYYSIIITKNIPVFGGLGGGTGNSASILIHLFKKKKIDKVLLDHIESKIGSDFKLFFYKQGFLKNLRSIIEFKKKQKLFFVLIQPQVKCSTKEIYSSVRNYSKKKTLKKNKINSKLKFIRHLSKGRNELQSIVEKKYPIIKELLINIKNEKGCHFSRMTGSGSVCYGLFDNKFEAKKALKNLKIKYPNLWSSVAKTV